MKPIPCKLLIHSATVITETPDPENVFEERTIESTVALSRVRVEPSSSLTVGKQNEQVRVSARLFYDCHNSRPSGFDFEHAQRIEFDGDRYNITNIGKFYDESGLHHYEVEMCL